MAEEWILKEQYLPIAAPFSNGSLERSARSLETVLDQFPVATHERWKPIQTSIPPPPNVEGAPVYRWTTWCNIFIWDATRALGCEIPHWGWGVVRFPNERPVAGLVKELRANDLQGWLLGAGKTQGWGRVEFSGALIHARAGRPVIVLYVNPTGTGHVAMLRPDGGIAQAGRTCFSRGSLQDGFGRLPVTFWSHT